LTLAIVLISLLALLIPGSVAVAADEIDFPDTVLREAIRDAIGGGDISQAKLDLLTSFSYGSSSLPDITDLTGMGNCTSLTYLHLNYNLISDISALASLTSLTTLGLEGNQINDISVLSSLTSLERLGLILNQVSDISALASLTSLVHLELSGNQISNFTPLLSLANLSALYIGANHISDIPALESLTSLTDLDLGINQISDLSPLANLTGLTDLGLSINQISDISTLSSLTSLNSLGLSFNEISDISPLVMNGGLSSGDKVYLVGNPLSADSINNHIPVLEGRGVTVYYISGEGCFIATAAYGTSTALEIDTLRAFRDEVLLESTLGSQFVAFYYEFSPPVADFISKNSLLRTILRELVVDPVVWVIEATGALWQD